MLCKTLTKLGPLAAIMALFCGIHGFGNALAHAEQVEQKPPDDTGGTRFTGTWKLNEAKSKLSPGTPKNTTVVYKAVGDNVHITIDGTASDGKPTHNEWTGKFDGKDYPVTGDPSSDALSVKKLNDRTLAFTAKKDGEVTTTGRIVVSPDGKSRTVTASGTDPKGNKVKSTAVYEKQ